MRSAECRVNDRIRKCFLSIPQSAGQVFGPSGRNPQWKGVCVATSDSPRQMLDANVHTLIELARGGDRTAFARLVDHYWDRLYRWLYHLTRDQHTAEDLAQETFLKAYTGLAKFRSGTNFGAWLFRIGYNNFANHHRIARRWSESLPADLPARQPNPAEQAQSREALQELAQALHRLPSEFLAPLLLRIEEGLSFRQIADALDLTEETARWRVFKARQKLLTLLDPDCLASIEEKEATPTSTCPENGRAGGPRSNKRKS